MKLPVVEATEHCHQSDNFQVGWAFKRPSLFLVCGVVPFTNCVHPFPLKEEEEVVSNICSSYGRFRATMK